MTFIPSLTYTELSVVSIEYLQRVWLSSRERLSFRTPGSVPQGLGSEEEEKEVSLRIRKVKKKRYKKRSASIVNPAPILPALSVHLGVHLGVQRARAK